MGPVLQSNVWLRGTATMEDVMEEDDPWRVADELLAEYGADLPGILAREVVDGDQRAAGFWAAVFVIAKARLSQSGQHPRPAAATA